MCIIFQGYDNCEVLEGDTYQARWTVTGATIKIALSARISPGTYMAFGLSGSTTRTAMVGSDVAVTWIPEGQSQAKAVDYYLNAYQQVSHGFKSC